jgi:predicted metalloprotease
MKSGHHRQIVTNIADRREHSGRTRWKTEATQPQTRMKVQAHCYADVWATHAHEHRHCLEPADVESAFKGSAAVGDDTIQKRTQGNRADTFTHDKAQRPVSCFRMDVETGSMPVCNTF